MVATSGMLELHVGGTALAFGLAWKAAAGAMLPVTATVPWIGMAMVAAGLFTMVWTQAQRTLGEDQTIKMTLVAAACAATLLQPAMESLLSALYTWGWEVPIAAWWASSLSLPASFALGWCAFVAAAAATPFIAITAALSTPLCTAVLSAAALGACIEAFVPQLSLAIQIAR